MFMDQIAQDILTFIKNELDQFNSGNTGAMEIETGGN
jgi:hypothetical protein